MDINTDREFTDYKTKEDRRMNKTFAAALLIAGTMGWQIMGRIEGQYENLEYRNQNSWHIVEIERTGPTTAKWTNNAGKEWTLTQ